MIGPRFGAFKDTYTAKFYNSVQEAYPNINWKAWQRQNGAAKGFKRNRPGKVAGRIDSINFQINIDEGDGGLHSLLPLLHGRFWCKANTTSTPLAESAPTIVG